MQRFASQEKPRSLGEAHCAVGTRQITTHRNHRQSQSLSTLHPIASCAAPLYAALLRTMVMKFSWTMGMLNRYTEAIGASK